VEENRNMKEWRRLRKDEIMSHVTW